MNLFLKAMDTETTSDGIARIVATDTGYKRVHSFEEIAEFLKGPLREKTVYECWNLGFDTRAIIKWLPSDLWKPLWDNQVVEYDRYKLRMFGGKKFSIGYPAGKRFTWAHFYDIASFYGYQRLDDAATQYLGRQKQDFSGWVDVVRTFQDPERELENLDRNEAGVGGYCQIDCELTLELTRFMFKALEAIGVDTKNPISPAALAGQLMQTKNPDYPNPETWHTEDFTKPTYRGGLFSCMKRGKFDQPIYEYDISSAYPAIQSTLPHWGNGAFEITDDPDKLWEADYGWVLANFDCHWIPYVTDVPYLMEVDYSDGAGFNQYLANSVQLYYPDGDRVQPITLKEACWMRDHGYRVALMNGLIWNKTNDRHPERPFKYLADMFHERIGIIKDFGKNDMRQYAMKLILNSTYGKTVQDPVKYGYRVPTLDFGYGSYITAETRLMVADAAIRHPGEVIEIATDAVYLLETDDVLECPEDKVLGTWELSTYDGGLWIGGGIKQYWKDGKSTTKARGFTNDRRFDLEGALREVGEESTYAHYKHRPLSLGEILRAVNNPELFQPQLLNTFRDVGRKLSVNMDTKRYWYRYPETWFEFLDEPIDSRPWTIDEIIEGRPYIEGAPYRVLVK